MQASLDCDHANHLALGIFYGLPLGIQGLLTETDTSQFLPCETYDVCSLFFSPCFTPIVQMGLEISSTCLNVTSWIISYAFAKRRVTLQGPRCLAEGFEGHPDDLLGKPGPTDFVQGS